MIKVKVENEGINGMQRIMGYIGNDHIITLNDAVLDREGKGMWRVASSKSFPSDMEESRLIAKCIKKVFEKYEKIK